MDVAKVLGVLAEAHPAVYDIWPRLDVFASGSWRTTVGEAVALNPQPLPPLTGIDPYVLGAHRMAVRLAELAVDSQIRGEGTEFLDACVEEWCGTPWPRRFPLPVPGPGPGDGPHPDPWKVAAGRALTALVFTSYGARLSGTDLGVQFGRVAEKLAEVATAERG